MMVVRLSFFPTLNRNLNLSFESEEIRITITITIKNRIGSPKMALSPQRREKHLQILRRQLRRLFAAFVQQSFHQPAFALLQGQDFLFHRSDRDELVNENRF